MVGTGAKSKNFGPSFRRLLGRLRPFGVRIGIVMVLAIISVTFAIAGPKLLGKATNVIFDGAISNQIDQMVVAQGLPSGQWTQAQVEKLLRAQGKTDQADMIAGMTLTPGKGIDFQKLGQYLALAALVYILSAAFAWMQAYIIAGVAQKTVYKLREDVDTKLARLPLRYFDNNSRGDILSRVTNDIDNIANTLQQSLTQIITAVFTLIGVLIMMFSISWLLALISLVTVPLSVVVTMVIAKQSQKQFAIQWDRTGALNGQVEEMHTGHSLVKVFGRQADSLAVFDAENEKLYQASFRAQFVSGIIMPSMQFIGNLSYVAIAVIGGVQVAKGALSLGDVQAFIQYSRQFTQPITQTASIANVLQSAVASSERVFELLDEPEELPDVENPTVLTAIKGRVVLEDVAFRYDEDKPLIEDFNLDVQPGDTVAIVGPTGAGKTTIVNLLMRFYEIDRGRILIDGVDTREMTRNEVRSHFGMVLQDTWLFTGTIRDNIAYGRENATEDEIIAASTAAHVDHFVRTLPQGYDTVLDDDATSVSQGERQLLTIARAFLADPDILILDEATSSVDTRTEVLIQKAMAKLMENRTSFVIAHRLSTIRDANTIVVMNEGRIVETGNHEQLLARHGFYYELYNSQFVEALDEAS